MSKGTFITSFETAALCANLAEDKKAKDTLVLQTEMISTLADYFVITSVDSRTQMRALSDDLLKSMRPFGLEPIGIEIDKSGHWSVIDFGDVVVHILHRDDRSFYQLERFWNHATEIHRDLWVREERKAS